MVVCPREPDTNVVISMNLPSVARAQTIAVQPGFTRKSHDLDGSAGKTLARQREAFPHSGIRADGAYSVPSGDSFLIKRSIFLFRSELNIAYAYFYPELLVNLQIR